ncbi:hypothetical protein D3C80_2098160 [compost metagenome]
MTAHRDHTDTFPSQHLQQPLPTLAQKLASLGQVAEYRRGDFYLALEHFLGEVGAEYLAAQVDDGR